MLDHTCHIVFATNFSDACYSAIPAVARWLDQLQCRLTILHVYDPDRAHVREVQGLLNSFFAEADNYPQCDRVLIAGDPISGITSYCENLCDALLLLPPSDQFGLPRPFHRSIRAEMIGRLSIPIWTLGRTLVGEPMPTSSHHIAALVTDPDEGTAHLRYAAQYAHTRNATLHLLHVLPEINESTMLHTLYSSAPLGVETAEFWLSDIASSLEPATRLELHIRQGSVGRLLPTLLERSGADTLFVSQQAAVGSRFLRPLINPIFSRINAGILAIPNVPARKVVPEVRGLATGLRKAS